jgi:hypothetical protein
MESFLDDGSGNPILTTAGKLSTDEGKQRILEIFGLVFCNVLHTDINVLVQRRLILSHTYAYIGQFITRYVSPGRERDRIPLKCQFYSVSTRIIGDRNASDW